MKDEIARLKGRVHTDQINISVEHRDKERYRALKDEYGVNVSEEARKAVLAMLDRLERAVAKGA